MESHLMFKDKGIRFTPERERVYAAMLDHDEGLGERAYRCLLQLADSAPLHPFDEEWLTDGIEPPEIARMGENGCELTAFGRLLVDAANRGDVEMMFALTTRRDLLDKPAWGVYEEACTSCGKKIVIVATVNSVEHGYAEAFEQGAPVCLTCKNLPGPN